MKTSMAAQLGIRMARPSLRLRPTFYKTSRLLSSRPSLSSSRNPPPWTHAWKRHQHDAPLRNRFDPLARQQTELERRQAIYRRMYRAGAGLALTVLATIILVTTTGQPPVAQNDALDAPRPSSTDPSLDKGSNTHDRTELVPTQATAVPFFPKIITLPRTESTRSPALPAGIGDADEEYHLLGLGVRTVSFLSIKVYVVGLYVAASDLATLQSRFIKEAAAAEQASTLVSDEKERLRSRLNDPEQSERIWNEVLQPGPLRTIVRVVPVRNTDYAHLRDGWLRGITSRSTGRGKNSSDYDDEAFGVAIGTFKQLFSGAGRKSLPTGQAMLLERDGRGRLTVWVQNDSKDKAGFSPLGSIGDERISRLIWLGYLGGKSVSSEDARRNIVDGVLEVVGRPIGTVETQVV